MKIWTYMAQLASSRTWKCTLEIWGPRLHSKTSSCTTHAFYSFPIFSLLGATFQLNQLRYCFPKFQSQWCCWAPFSLHSILNISKVALLCKNQGIVWVEPFGPEVLQFLSFIVQPLFMYLHVHLDWFCRTVANLFLISLLLLFFGGRILLIGGK